jgi:hypothetical protein
MTGKLRDLTVNRDGTQNVTVTVTSDFTKTYDELKGKEVSVEIRKAAKGRSKDANAFMWAMCSLIGRSLKPPVEKEEVYRHAIKAVGVYTQTQLLMWHIPTVKQRWESHGTGWFLEVVDDVPGLVGHKTINLYYGSSTYTVDEMRLLIDWLVDQAEQMELPIPLSKKEEEEMLERWGKR